MVDGEETGGEEDEKGSRPGQRQVEIRENKREEVKGSVRCVFCFTTCDLLTFIYLTNLS